MLDSGNVHALVNEYAPTLRESDLDPVEVDPTDSPASGGAADVDLPDFLDDEENRKKIGAGGIVVGILLIANPWGVQVPIEVLGTLVALGAVAVWQRPEAVWGLVTPDRTVHREFSNGGAVVEEKESIKYESPDDREDVEFEKGDDRDRRQRAAVFGVLDEDADGALTVTDPGVLPTNIASAGPKTIAPYRYAVHRERPAEIADDLKITQKEVVDLLVDMASK